MINYDRLFSFFELHNTAYVFISGVRAIRKLSENNNFILKISVNYIILFICIAGFAGGGMLALILPVFQIGLSWFNYHYSKKWQTVLLLEVHLLISTVIGLCFEGYLYLRYISEDAESVLVFEEIRKIGTAFVCGMAIITTFFKYLSAKRQR